MWRQQQPIDSIVSHLNPLINTCSKQAADHIAIPIEIYTRVSRTSTLPSEKNEDLFIADYSAITSEQLLVVKEKLESNPA